MRAGGRETEKEGERRRDRGKKREREEGGRLLHTLRRTLLLQADWIGSFQDFTPAQSQGRETLPILFSKPEFPPPSSRTRLPGKVEKISGTRKIHRYAHRPRGMTSIREESFGDDLS